MGANFQGDLVINDTVPCGTGAIGRAGRNLTTPLER